MSPVPGRVRSVLDGLFSEIVPRIDLKKLREKHLEDTNRLRAKHYAPPLVYDVEIEKFPSSSNNEERH